jgi:hypothetical protein
VPSVEASSISFSDGVHAPWVVADNSADDLNGLVGWITAAGGYADTFLYFAETGITKPILGSAESPIMFASVTATSQSANQTLVVTFTEDNYGPSGLAGDSLASVDMQGQGSVNYLLLQDLTNALNSGVAVAGGTVNGPGVDLLIYDHFSLVGGTFPYALTQAFVIHHESAELQTTDITAAVQVVPDGGSALTMLGLGMIGLGAIRRKLSL